MTVCTPLEESVSWTAHTPAFTLTFIAGVPNAVTSNGVPPPGMIPDRDFNAFVESPTMVARDAIPRRCCCPENVAPSAAEPRMPGTELAIIAILTSRPDGWGYYEASVNVDIDFTDKRPVYRDGPGWLSHRDHPSRQIVGLAGAVVADC